MNERFIYLNEKCLDGDITTEEKSEFENLLASDSELKKEFDEQVRIKEVLTKMKLKNPSVEIWDSYWLGVYNKMERGLAWILVSLGAVILIVYGTYEGVSEMLKDTSTPAFVKIGVTALQVGGLILLLSVLREKLFTRKHDKYKEIQR
ncbi:MAG: hypothetical protein KAR20_29390 [Candidatus Heimdallarchaeota archaeon]|nr:hypothetical protein [Candidatus Heimdallarchaeota archaeon]